MDSDAIGLVLADAEEKSKQKINMQMKMKLFAFELDASVHWLFKWLVLCFRESSTYPTNWNVIRDEANNACRRGFDKGIIESVASALILVLDELKNMYKCAWDQNRLDLSFAQLFVEKFEWIRKNVDILLNALSFVHLQSDSLEYSLNLRNYDDITAPQKSIKRIACSCSQFMRNECLKKLLIEIMHDYLWVDLFYLKNRALPTSPIYTLFIKVSMTIRKDWTLFAEFPEAAASLLARIVKHVELVIWDPYFELIDSWYEASAPSWRIIGLDAYLMRLSHQLKLEVLFFSQIVGGDKFSLIQKLEFGILNKGFLSLYSVPSFLFIFSHCRN